MSECSWGDIDTIGFDASVGTGVGVGPDEGPGCETFTANRFSGVTPLPAGGTGFEAFRISLSHHPPAGQDWA